MSVDRERISYMVGIRIRNFRIERKMSQEALTLASELHPAYLGRLERGEKCPTVETLHKIAMGLKLPISELLDISAEIKPTSTEAMYRIKTALLHLSDEEALQVAEIVENVVSFKYRKGEFDLPSFPAQAPKFDTDK